MFLQHLGQQTYICEFLFLSMQSIQNLGLAVMSIVAGEILDIWGYFFLEIFFIACVSGKYLIMNIFGVFFWSLGK